MAKRSTRTLSDAFLRAKPKGKGAKPARISLILGGMKYKPGQAPARVCPAGRAKPKAFATPLR